MLHSVVLLISPRALQIRENRESVEHSGTQKTNVYNILVAQTRKRQATRPVVGRATQPVGWGFPPQPVAGRATQLEAGCAT